MKIFTLSLLILSSVTYVDAGSNRLKLAWQDNCDSAGLFASEAVDIAERAQKKTDLQSKKKLTKEASDLAQRAIIKARKCGCPASKKVKEYAQDAYNWFLEAYYSDTLSEMNRNLKSGWDSANDVAFYIVDCPDY